MDRTCQHGVGATISEQAHRAIEMAEVAERPRFLAAQRRNLDGGAPHAAVAEISETAAGGRRHRQRQFVLADGEPVVAGLIDRRQCHALHGEGALRPVLGDELDMRQRSGKRCRATDLGHQHRWRLPLLLRDLR